VSTHKPVTTIFGFQRTKEAGSVSLPPPFYRTSSRDLTEPESPGIHRLGPLLLPDRPPSVKGFFPNFLGKILGRDG